MLAGPAVALGATTDQVVKSDEVENTVESQDPKGGSETTPVEGEGSPSQSTNGSEAGDTETEDTGEGANSESEVPVEVAEQEVATEPAPASRSIARAALAVAPSGVTKCSIPQGSYSAAKASGLVRLEGANRYATAASIAKHVGSSSATSERVLFLASGGVFADGLALSALAARTDWPIVLTATNQLSPEAAAVVASQVPTHVYIAGGTGAVSSQVEQAVKALSAEGVKVTRFDGADRYDTAAKIAGCFEAGTPAFLTTGDDFPDAVVAAAPAAKLNGAIVLTKRGSLNDVAAQALETLEPSSVNVIGGTWSNAEKASIKSSSGTSSVNVYAGSDRYATSATVAAGFFSGATSGVFATGTNFPDALAGGVVADLNQAPLLLTQKDCRPKQIETVANAAKNKVILGGPATVSNASATTTCKPAPVVPAYIKVVNAAKQQVGKAYSWAGVGPNSFDCSGLTQYAHKQAGISIPRQTGEQWSKGKRVSSPRPGDIVVLGGGSHVGIYISPGVMVDAGNPRVGVSQRAIYDTPNAYVRFT